LLYPDPDQLLAEVLEEEGEDLLAAAMEGVAAAVAHCIVTCSLVSASEDHEEETSEAGGLPSQFTCFVDKLPTCMSKQMVDEVI